MLRLSQSRERSSVLSIYPMYKYFEILLEYFENMRVNSAPLPFSFLVRLRPPCVGLSAQQTSVASCYRSNFPSHFPLFVVPKGAAREEAVELRQASAEKCGARRRARECGSSFSLERPAALGTLQRMAQLTSGRALARTEASLKLQARRTSQSSRTARGRLN